MLPHTTYVTHEKDIIGLTLCHKCAALKLLNIPSCSFIYYDFESESEMATLTLHMTED